MTRKLQKTAQNYLHQSSNIHLSPEAVLGRFYACTRSRLLIPVFLLAWMSPVHGDTIENFVILNSSNPSVPGGTFFRGGTYSGSFSVDTSLIPSNGNRAMFSLQTFDIAIAVPTLNIDADFSPANGATATFDAEAALDIGSSFPSLIQVDNIEFHGFAGAMLDLLLIEPVGIFQGGLVAFAQGQGPFGGLFFDVSGSAIVIDPAVVPTPEPNVGLLLAGGLCLFAGLAKRRGFWCKFLRQA